MSGTLAKEHVVGSHSPKARPNVEQESIAAGVPATPSKRLGRRWVLTAVAAAAALMGAAGGWSVRHYATATTPATDALQDGANDHTATLGFAQADVGVKNASMARVETIGVEMVPRRNLLRLTGTLNADERSNVASNANGIVAEVRVDRGSVVKKGDVLVILDPTDAKNRLAEGTALVEELKAKLTWDDESAPFIAEEQPAVKLAKTSRALAATRKQRAESLLPKKAIAIDECEQYQSEYECAVQRCRQALEDVRQDYQAYQTAVAKLAALRKAVADTTILAPLDGIVAEKHVAVGEQVTGGFVASKIVTMVRTNPLRLSVTLPQQDIGQIEPGQKVRFHVDSYPDKTFEAKVRYISPGVTNDTRALLVEAVVDNSDGALCPGLFATAELEVSAQRTDMLVPAAAVQRTGEVARVLVVRNGVAREQVVALGEEAKGKVQVTSGLTGKEILICRPELSRDGDVVR